MLIEGQIRDWICNFPWLILAKYCPETDSENYEHFDTFSMHIQSKLMPKIQRITVISGYYSLLKKKWNYLNLNFEFIFDFFWFLVQMKYTLVMLQLFYDMFQVKEQDQHNFIHIITIFRDYELQTTKASTVLAWYWSNTEWTKYLYANLMPSPRQHMPEPKVIRSLGYGMKRLINVNKA